MLETRLPVSAGLVCRNQTGGRLLPCRLIGAARFLTVDREIRVSRSAGDQASHHDYSARFAVRRTPRARQS